MKQDNQDQQAPHKSFKTGKEKKSYSVTQNNWRRCFLALGCALFVVSGIFFGESGEASRLRRRTQRSSHLKSDAQKHRKGRAAHKAAKENESRLESEPKQEGEFEDDINERQNWFYSQRAYPFNSIPEQTREKAWASRLIGQDEKNGPTSAAPYWGNIGPSPTTASLAAQIGTTSGRINAIAVSPANDQLILVGSATGGIWRSSNGGASFTSVSDNQVDLAVGSIAFAPSDPSIVYAGMGDGPGFAISPGGYLGTGVLKSTDAGVSWTRINNATLPAEGTTIKIGVDPSNPDRVYLARLDHLVGAGRVTSGLWVSTTGGVSWSLKRGGEARDFAISPANAQTIYVAMSIPDVGVPGVYKSTNGGNSFAAAPIYTSPLSPTKDIRVAVSPSNALKIYVYCGDQFNNGNLRLAVSSDGGATFPTNLSLNTGAVDDGQMSYNTYLAAHPTNENTVYIGSRDIFKSTDGGFNWSNLTNAWTYQCSGTPTVCKWNYTPAASSAHSDQHVLTFSPTSSNVIYIGSDGGLQKSTNGGGAFASLNDTLSLSQFIGYALHPTNSAFAYGGTQDNGTQRRQVAGPVYSHWQEFNGGDGGHCVIDPSDTSIIFSTYVQCSVFRHLDSGGTFGAVSNNATFGEPAAPANPRVSFYPPLVGNGVNSTIYFGTWRLFVNTNPVMNLSNPLAWFTPTTTPANQDLTKGGNDVLSAIGVGHQAYNNLQEIYTGSAQGRVMSSINGGATFTEATGLPNRAVTSITVDPENSAIAFVTFSGFQSQHVFRTMDFGESWTNISANLDQDLPVNTFLLDPVASGTYYAGTDTGVFRSTDAGGVWESYNNGLPPVIVNALVGQPGGTIHAATYGRGAYELVKQFDLSGTVKRSTGVPIDGATITLVGDGRTTTTDAVGNYAFANLTGGLSYSVTPTKPGYTFAPASQTLTLTSDTTLADFVGTPPAPIAYTFIGGANGCNPQGDTTAWSNPCNWSPQGVPTENDVVTTGNNTINAGSVRVSAIVINGGTFTGTINVANAGQWTGGLFSGVLNIETGANFAIEGDDKFLANATVNNSGTIFWSGSDISGHIKFYGNVVINNTGRFSATTDGLVLRVHAFPSSLAFVNNGIFEKTGGSGVTRCNDYGTFNNTSGGIINSNSGILQFVYDLQLSNNSFITGAGVVKKVGGTPGVDEVVVKGLLTITGNFELNGALLGDPGATIVSTGNRFRWTGGGIRGEINVPSGTQLNLEGNDKSFTNATLNNGGTIVWSEVAFSGRIKFSGTVVVNNTGRFSATTDGVVFQVAGFPANMTINNNGIFEKAGGSGVTRFIDYGTFSNNSGGIIHSASGIVQFWQDLQLKNNSFITGGGLVQKSGGSPGVDEVVVKGLLTVTGNFELNGALLGDPGATIVSAGNRFRWTGGGIRGEINIPAGTQLNLEGNDKSFTNATLNNGGTIVWSEVAFSGRIKFSGTVVVNNTGRFSATTDGVVFQVAGFPATMTINNNGVFEKTGGSGGTRFTDYGTFNNNSGGAISIQTGLVYVVALSMTPTSRIDTRIAGASQGSGYSQLRIDNGVTLDGILNINLAGSFSPAVSSTFPLVVYGSHTGTFSQINPPAVNWRTFTTQYNSGDLTLTAGPPPTYSVPTPAGTDVRVTAGGLSLTFDNVKGAASPQGIAYPLVGATTVTPIDPNSAGPAPGGFIITQDSVAYEITTTAIYTGTIKIDVPLTTNLRNIRSQLGLLHGESGVLVDRTIPTNNFSTISARVTSLSPFVVAQSTGCVSSVVTSGQVAGTAATQSFAAGAANGGIDVTSQGTCNWTATSNDSWIAITSGGGGAGNGTVTYSVAANTATTIRSGSITISGQRFTVLQGAAFLDVGTDNIFYTYIGKLSARGVTVGCGNGNYCPNDPVTREQMAAFIVRALGDFTPATPAQQRFADVLPANPFYPFIDEMAVRQITVGCGGGNYCPSSPVLREQMAAFMIRALGEFSPPTPGSQRFDDVSPANPFYNFIDRMAVLQITSGCSPVLYCPASPVTRAQMAVFLVRAFNL